MPGSAGTEIAVRVRRFPSRATVRFGQQCQWWLDWYVVFSVNVMRPIRPARCTLIMIRLLVRGDQQLMRLQSWIALDLHRLSVDQGVGVNFARRPVPVREPVIHCIRRSFRNDERSCVFSQCRCPANWLWDMAIGAGRFDPA